MADKVVCSRKLSHDAHVFRVLQTRSNLAYRPIVDSDGIEDVCNGSDVKVKVQVQAVLGGKAPLSLLPINHTAVDF